MIRGCRPDGATGAQSSQRKHIRLGVDVLDVWPWGHLAFGYLIYAIVVWIRRRRAPTGWPVVALAFGTQFPDLVDKPLAYTVHLFPEGRSLAHSVLFAIPISVAVVLWFRRRGHGGIGAAFATGYLSHLVADGLSAGLAGHYRSLSFLLWPVLPAPDYPVEAFGDHWHQLSMLLAGLSLEDLVTGWSDPFVRQLWLTLLVFALWLVITLPKIHRIVRER